jgi:ArsR family transcriptional regulator
MPVPRITREELKQRLDQADTAPVILDVRLKYPYEHSTVKLPGAIRVSSGEPDLSAIPKGRDVVAYDSDPNELVSSKVVATLIRNGFKAAALKGGIVEWLAANLPTETKEAPRASSVPAPGSLKS